MKNMKIAKKLIVSFLIVIALAVVVGVVGIFGMAKLNAADSDMYDYNLLAIAHIADLRELFQEERVLLRTAILSAEHEPDKLQDTLDSVDSTENELVQAMAAYESTMGNPDAEGAYFETKNTYNGKWQEIKDNILSLAESGDTAAAYEVFSDAIPTAAIISKGLDESGDSNEQWASQLSADNDTLYSTLLWVQVGVLAATVVIAIFLALKISNMISRPVKTMVDVANHIAVGDMNMSADYVSEDEIGDLSQAFNTMEGGINEQVRLVERLAAGDLTIEVVPRSPEDSMGHSLEKMVANLNNMFKGINTSTVQVSSGARQIASGAQTLAQGSTEQAAAAEELSAAVSEVSEKTKNNSEMAEKAAKLSSMVRENAEQGAGQMQNMVDAVSEINEASQSISNVIKVIDDIAFQTNILALNAAVEAARAGNHGKGFAVVAEEVRNLAAKSAEAAKDTNDMIVASIEKAEIGLKIAEETSLSLKKIVEGVNESASIMQDIASASEEQSLAIKEINLGIDQVAQVVQQNSATSEESAASSEEMSSQSDMLRELVSRFKLKESGYGFTSFEIAGKKQSAGSSHHTRTDSYEDAEDDIGGKY